MDAKDWTSIFFFSQSPPNFIKENPETQEDFKPFQPDPKWSNWFLGTPLATGRDCEPDRNQVFWLVAEDDRGTSRKYVAKVYPESTEERARAQLRRYPAPHSPRKVMKELDHFENEAKVFHRIEKFCDNALVYFPRFYGVITDLSKSRFRRGYVNRRAIIFERIVPKLSSRRILAAVANDDTQTKQHIESLRSRLQSLDLSDFEGEFYRSLLTDRCRRLSTLHSLAITHGDVKDEHFRIPGDFYDGVFYDFSHSYTFSPELPYSVNIRKPRPLKDIAHLELRQAELHTYRR
ncbi:hypothetical protein N7535_002267 [Penicillium sp. DV-2018c]|nr:hypothetical protein N7461_004490 [Penicillium sp. DV-2018c]KAJ5583647.1 hypothetical protein N7535_002267 [Penicillium sp. DV-2018c]